MVRRTLEASYRDIGSTKADQRLGALRDLMGYCRDNEDDRERTSRALVLVLDDAHAGLRAEALSALCELNLSHALPRMLTAIEDADPYVRQIAIRALGELGDARAQGRLTRALTDERPEVRYQATIAFARLCIDPDDKAKALAARVEDADPEVSHIALRVAEEWLDDEGVAPAALLDAAAAHLGDVPQGPAAQVVLAATILHTKAALRAGNPIDKRALSVLHAIVASRFAPDLPDEDECEALELAGEVGLTDAIAGLQKRAFGLRRFFGRPQSRSSLVALALLGDERARSQLREELRTVQGINRERIVLSAARARLREAADPLAELIENEPENGSLRRMHARLAKEPIS